LLQVPKDIIAREIERPLGQTGRRAKPRRRLPSARSLFGALVGLAVVGAAGAIALRERPYRQIVETVVTTPEIVAPVAEANATRPAAPKSQDGPKIIKVQPDPDAPSGPIVISDPTAVGQDLRVAHLPDPGLIEETENGMLPMRSADGRRPMDVYARSWSGARGPRVAIVVGGLGLSQTGSLEAIDRLPPEVTLGFAPSGNSLQRWMQEARRKGHELVLQIPLEPFDYPSVDPGRNTLTVDADPNENLDRLHWALGRITNYTGVMNYMGGRFLSEPSAMQPLFDELSQRGLLFVDDGSSARSTAPDMAVKSRVAFASSETTIDARRERGAILSKLDELEASARARGFAIGTASAFPESVDAITKWVAEARKRGIEIVPISAVVADPEHG